MRVLDLFSGTGGWSEAFLDRGHHVIRLDNNPKFRTVPHTLITDVLNYDFSNFKVDVILASPPCEKFSVSRIRDNWIGSKTTPLVPRHEASAQALFLLETTLRIVYATKPKYWWLENPMGAMRRMDCLQDVPRTTVTLCKYGKHYRKPTDLWGEWPDTWLPEPPCTGHPRHGALTLISKGGKKYVLDAEGRPCHESASRGSKTGVQGLKDATERGKIPYALSTEVCIACESAGL